MFTENEPDLRNLGQLDEFLPGMNPTSGGSRDTEENDPTARPVGLPTEGTPVMTATPVVKWPSTCRNLCASNDVGIIELPPGESDERRAGTDLATSTASGCHR
jgi:hypothetical protein